VAFHIISEAPHLTEHTGERRIKPDFVKREQTSLSGVRGRTIPKVRAVRSKQSLEQASGLPQWLRTTVVPDEPASSALYRSFERCLRRCGVFSPGETSYDPDSRGAIDTSFFDRETASRHSPIGVVLLAVDVDHLKRLSIAPGPSAMMILPKRYEPFPIDRRRCACPRLGKENKRVEDAEICSTRLPICSTRR